jgi:gas vesicle protein
MTHEEQPRSSGNGFALFLTFAGGALIGGIAALLLAPRSGAETRRRIAGAAEDTRDAAARLPHALQAASSAAQEAFSVALGAEANGRDRA